MNIHSAQITNPVPVSVSQTAEPTVTSMPRELAGESFGSFLQKLAASQPVPTKNGLRSDRTQAEAEADSAVPPGERTANREDEGDVAKAAEARPVLRFKVSDRADIDAATGEPETVDRRASTGAEQRFDRFPNSEPANQQKPTDGFRREARPAAPSTDAGTTIQKAGSTWAHTLDADGRGQHPAMPFSAPAGTGPDDRYWPAGGQSETGEAPVTESPQQALPADHPGAMAAVPADRTTPEIPPTLDEPFGTNGHARIRPGGPGEKLPVVRDGADLHAHAVRSPLSSPEASGGRAQADGGAMVRDGLGGSSRDSLVPRPAANPRPGETAAPSRDSRVRESDAPDGSTEALEGRKDTGWKRQSFSTFAHVPGHAKGGSNTEGNSAKTETFGRPESAGRIVTDREAPPRDTEATGQVRIVVGERESGAVSTTAVPSRDQSPIREDAPAARPHTDTRAAAPGQLPILPDRTETAQLSSLPARRPEPGSAGLRASGPAKASVDRPNRGDGGSLPDTKSVGPLDSEGRIRTEGWRETTESGLMRTEPTTSSGPFQSGPTPASVVTVQWQIGMAGNPDGFVRHAVTEAIAQLSNVGEAIAGAATDAAGSTPHRAEILRYPAAQIADGLVRHPERPVEITLNPEELGRVKFRLHAGEGNISVIVTVERGETIDLMRRHIDVLAQEFRRLGYEGIGFEFRQSGNGANHQNRRAPTTGRPAADAKTPHSAPSPRPQVAASGLDIRI